MFLFIVEYADVIEILSVHGYLFYFSLVFRLSADDKKCIALLVYYTRFYPAALFSVSSIETRRLDTAAARVGGLTKYK